MRNSLLLSSILCASVSFAAQLTPGNILVLQAGSSLVPYANGSWNEGTILEFSPTGTLVQTIPLPAGMAIHPDTKIELREEPDLLLRCVQESGYGYQL